MVTINDSNTHLSGLTFDGSSGYGIEIGDGATAFENVSVSGVVFVNNALGGIHIQGPANGSAVSYTIENNTFVGDDYGITISANANSSGVIRNNIFAGQSIVPIQITSTDDGTVDYGYNLFYDCGGGSCAPGNWKSGNLGVNSNEHNNLFDLDPLFANPANGDYKLSSASPAIDAGDPAIIHEFLFDGNGDGIPNADIGAFEYTDFDAPVVQSITRASSNPTDAAFVNFTVTFSEPVIGVDTSDFALLADGVSDTFIAAVSGEGSVYTVEVNTGNGDGTIRLDIPVGTDISDIAGNPLAGLPYVNGETYTVIKTIIPTATPTITPTPTPTAPPNSEFEIDDFAGPQLEPGWEWYVPQAGPSYSLSAVPGSLRMSLPPGQYFEHWETEDNAPQLRRYDMGDQDWAIEARLENIHAAPDAAGYWAALVVGFGQYDQIWYGMVDDGYLREIRVGNCCSSFDSYQELPVALRLEKHGENYTFFYKHDADTNWTELNTQNYPGVPTYVGLIGRSWDTGSSALEFDWSYFRLERPETPGGPGDVVVTVLDTEGTPKAGLNTYVFNAVTYTGLHGVTDENGQINFSLPEGSYRFRTDLNGTHFWSGAANHCDVPNCGSANITVTNPVTVTVQSTDNTLQAGLQVYAFNGTTYTGYHGVTDANGQAVFTLPLGSYRFRADLNGTQFWSAASNHCDMLDCTQAGITVTIPVFVDVYTYSGEAVSGVNVYAFDGATYTGYHQVTDETGTAYFTLPEGGDYHFRADYTAPGAGNSVQYWSTPNEWCNNVLACPIASVEVANPVTVSVLDTDSIPAEGLHVYAFNDVTYTGYHLTTDSNGQATFTLPFGSYRFRADLNGTQFWSGSGNHCDVPDCSGAQVTVTSPITVTVQDTEGVEKEGIMVYAFNGAAYTGYNAMTNANGQTIFTLPQGSYRFRADLNGTQFWSGPSNHCNLPGCTSAEVSVTNEVLVSVHDTSDVVQAGLKVYAFNGSTYTGYSATTNINGQAAFTLPIGNYRFRADLNGTQFWSGAVNHCGIPGCTSSQVTVTNGMLVTVRDTDSIPRPGLKVYAFNGSTYTGYNATTDANGQVIFTLPQGSYRFRADLNSTQFWSGASNHCDIPGCGSVDITVAKPIVVNVLNTDNLPQAGLKVYAFNGSTYTGYNATTNANGQVTLTLPQGSYRFRADLNGTQFWSGSSNHCDIPGCESADVLVTKPITVTVLNTDNAPQAGLKVYAFNGTTYTGFNATTNASGQVTFTLPQGNYRFRADLNNTQFWSGTSNHCALPGCDSADITVTIPVTITVQDGGGSPKTGIKVYVFNGTTYTGYSQITNANGQTVFTLPSGNYRFRADYNNVQFWSDTANHCALPGCMTAIVSIAP